MIPRPFELAARRSASFAHPRAGAARHPAAARDHEPPCRAGFTLIELLLVVVIIGILASIVAGSFTKVRERAMLATLQNDLRVLSIQQEIYYASNGIYASDPAVANFQPSPSVTLSITYSAHGGWAATADHAGYPGHQCGIFIGNAPSGVAAPATTDDIIACN